MSPALRCLHVTPYFEEAWAFGGIPRVASRLARGLARLGHEVTVVTTDVRSARDRLRPPPGSTSRAPWSLPREDDPDRLLVEVLPNRSHTLAHRHQLYTPRGLDSTLARAVEETDVGHLHACHNLLTARAAICLRRSRIPFVLHPNGTAPLVERRRLAKWLFDGIFARELLASADIVIGTSRDELRTLRRLGVSEARLRLLPNPLDLQEIASRPESGTLRERWGWEGPLVLYLGQLAPRKELATLVEATAQLPANVGLALVGPDRGVARALERRIRRFGLTDRVRIFPTVEGPGRLALLAEADVVAYPSRHEVFGLSALEALSVGTPVVVGNDSGCGEMVSRHGGGLTVAPGSSSALATALRQILASPDRFQSQAATARGSLRRELDIEPVCRRLESIYQELAGRRGEVA